MSRPDAAVRRGLDDADASMDSHPHRSHSPPPPYPPPKPVIRTCAEACLAELVDVDAATATVAQQHVLGLVHPLLAQLVARLVEDLRRRRCAPQRHALTERGCSKRRARRR